MLRVLCCTGDTKIDAAMCCVLFVVRGTSPVFKNGQLVGTNHMAAAVTYGIMGTKPAGIKQLGLKGTGSC